MPKSRGLAAPKLVGRSGHSGEVKAMERKAGRVEVLVTADEVRESLPKAKLSADEEKVLRMRHGVALAGPSESLPTVAPAGRPGGGQLLPNRIEMNRGGGRQRSKTRYQF